MHIQVNYGISSQAMVTFVPNNSFYMSSTTVGRSVCDIQHLHFSCYNNNNKLKVKFVANFDVLHVQIFHNHIVWGGCEYRIYSRPPHTNNSRINMQNLMVSPSGTKFLLIDLIYEQNYWFDWFLVPYLIFPSYYSFNHINFAFNL